MPTETQQLAQEVKDVAQEVKHLKELMELRFSNLDEAISVARERVDDRLEGMNELREQIQNERGQYLTRDSYDREHKALEIRVGALELQNSKWTGSLWMLGAALSAVVVIVNVLLKFWSKP